jgi:hypothetical protein
VKVLAQDDLRTVAFKVCTALHESGVTAVLTGGSAATVYAPEAYQSKDLDFVLQFVDEPGEKDAERVLESLGYTPENSQYVHPDNPLSLDFLSYPLAIGGDIIDRWATLNQAGMILHVLSPTDCCRDRLAHFLHWDDRAALSQAVAVARNHKIDLAAIRSWCERENQSEKFREFERTLGVGR